MRSLVARRLLAAPLLMWAALTLVFALVQLLPGQPFHMVEGPGSDPAAAEHLRRLFGADRSFVERYGAWLAGIATLDLGTSFSFRRPVAELIGVAVINTGCLAGLALVLQFALGTAAAIAGLWSRRRWLDRAVVAVASLVYSLPSFWLGLLLAALLAVKMGWFPVSQMRGLDAHRLDSWNRGLDLVHHLILPCLSLTLPAAGGIALLVREQLRSALTENFILSARARGLGRAVLLLRHGLRSALLPVVTLVGLSLPGLVGGSVVIEALFAWPGMGQLAYQAVLARDEPLILGCAAVGAGAVIAGNLAADLVSAVLDPRLREARP